MVGLVEIAMDVVGGVIVAAPSGKGGGGGSRDEDGGGGGVRGSGGARALMCSGMKRTRSGCLCLPGDHYGAASGGTFVAGSCSVASWEGSGGSRHHLWNRRVSPRRGTEGSAAAAPLHERDERDDHELRSVLSCPKTTTVSLSPPVGGARLGRSASWGDHHHTPSSFGTSDTTRALLAPFYRPANPVFVKPQPVPLQLQDTIAIQFYCHCCTTFSPSVSIVLRPYSCFKSLFGFLWCW